MKHQPIYLKIVLCLSLLLFVVVTSQVHAQSTRPVVTLPSRGATDIGAVGHDGSFIENGNTERIWASGSDIWGQQDQFHYVWFDLPGDGQMVTRILSQDNTNGWAKSGIMIRGSTADNAANVFLALTPQHGVTFQKRTATNAITTSLSGPEVTAPIWLKLARYNTTITGFTSTDGSSWTRVSSVTLNLNATSLIGLAVTSHNNQVRNRTVFSNVALTNDLPPVSTTATRVYGQGGLFTTAVANNGGTSADSLSDPKQVALDSNGNLYIADASNNRVLYYPAGSTTATRVYGQNGSFTTGTVNRGGISADSLDYPGAVALDRCGNLYVADTSNDRVLYYPAGTTTATRVYGQGGVFNTGTVNNGGISASSLNEPYGVAVDSNGNLYVADYGNERVLYYPSGTTVATRVYGQNGSFTTATSNNGGISATSLGGPSGVTLDSNGNLYVDDYTDSRVLYYPSGTTVATRVYGQNGSFTIGNDNNGGISANSLNYPAAMAVDKSGDLYITDYTNNRILYYPADSTTATTVYGQGGNFTTNTGNNGGVSATSLNEPEGIAVDNNGNLYIADYGNNRVLMFPST